MLYCQLHLIWLFVKPNERLNKYLHDYQYKKSTINKSLILFTAKHFQLSKLKKKFKKKSMKRLKDKIEIKTVIRQKMP